VELSLRVVPDHVRVRALRLGITLFMFHLGGMHKFLRIIQTGQLPRGDWGRCYHFVEALVVLRSPDNITIIECPESFDSTGETITDGVQLVDGRAMDFSVLDGQINISSHWGRLWLLRQGINLVKVRIDVPVKSVSPS